MDVEYTWEIEGHQNQPVASGSVPDLPAGPRWPFFLALLGVLATGFLLTWYQVTALQMQAETLAIRDVERNFDLAITAIEEEDEEVFELILPGANLEWTATQHQLFRESALFARTSFGLLISKTGQEIVHTELSPDLTQAEILSEQAYDLVQPAEPAGPIRLQFTTLLRKDDGQWSWQAPDASFWGAMQAIETGRLTLIFPRRDEQFMRRLAVDLDEEVDTLCDQLAMISCPPGVVLTMRMSIDPAVFMPPTESNLMRGEQEELVIPTPTLMGLPVDEAGYQAIRRGYAAQAAVAMVKNIIGWECSNPITLFLAAQEGRLVC